MQPRTGKTIWKYQASTRGINCSPLVDSDGIVYCGHGEQNASDTTVLGAIFAFDGNREGEIGEADLLWKIPKKTIGRSSPTKLGDRVYFLEDSAALLIVEAKTGKLIGQKKLGRIMFGSPTVGDGKLYVAENTGRFYVLEPSEKGVNVVGEARLPQGEEVFATPVISHGKIYLPSNVAFYCIGDASKTPATDAKGSESLVAGKEKPVSEDQAIAQIQVAPVEMMLAPGQKATLQVRGYNKLGQYIKLLNDVEFTVQGSGQVVPQTSDSQYQYVAAADKVPSSVILTAKSGTATTTARIRVIPPLPWKFDFNDEKVPPVWIGADYRHKKAEIGGEKALVKVSTIPKGTRSQAWMGWTTLRDYTVQADFQATEKGERLPDMGLINQRYTLDLQGSKRLQIRSWTPRLELRFAKTIEMDWKPNVWYTMKFQCEYKDGAAVLRGKVWVRGEKEPESWQIEAADKTPNLSGSPGLFGNASDAEFYIDNVQVYSNGSSAN